MRGILFTVFVVAALVAISLTAVGALINWGVIPTAMTQPGQTLPLLSTLAGASLVSFCGLLVELGRRFFIQTKELDEQSQLWLELVAAGVALPVASETEANQALSYVRDYLDDKKLTDDVRELMRRALMEQARETFRLRFGGAATPKIIGDVLPRK